VLVLNSYLQDATIFCDHSGIWNQMMIDKLTTDIKRTKTSFCCLIVELLTGVFNWLLNSKAVKTRLKTNEMPFLLVFLMYLLLTRYSLIMFLKVLSHLILKIKSFMNYFLRGLEIFQNFHEIFKYFKVKYLIVHLYLHVTLHHSNNVLFVRRAAGYNETVKTRSKASGQRLFL